MELYPGYLEDHFNIHKLRFHPGIQATPPTTPARVAVHSPPGSDSLVRVCVSFHGAPSPAAYITCCVRCQRCSTAPAGRRCRSVVLGSVHPESISVWLCACHLPTYLAPPSTGLCAVLSPHSPRAHSIHSSPALLADSCVLILLLVLQRHRRRLPAGVHDLGAVRAGAPQDGDVRARPAAAAAAPPPPPPATAPAAAGARHVEQRALQGGQRRPGHQRVQHHGARRQVRPRRARRRSADGRSGDGGRRRSGSKQAPREGLEKTRTKQRSSQEKSPKKEGLHPAARVEPDKVSTAGARAAARQAAAGGVRGQQPGDEPAAPPLGLGRPRVCGGGADDGPRRGGVRDRLRAVGGRAEAAHGGAAERAAAGTGHIGAGAADDGGDRARQLRPPLPDQGRRRAVRRLLRHVGALEVPRRALLPLDRRLPALRGPQDLEPAAGADDGAAVGGGVRAAADVGAGGGRADAGHAEAAADAGRVPDGPLRRPRRLHGRRRREAQGPRRLRPAGGPSPAGDAAEHAQDPDDAAGGQGPARAGGLLPAPPRAQHALGGPPARVRHKLNCTPTHAAMAEAEKDR